MDERVEEDLIAENQRLRAQKLAKSTVYITNADRQTMLTAFFENIIQTIDQATRDDLYRTIIERIILRKAGDDIKVSIKFN